MTVGFDVWNGLSAEPISPLAQRFVQRRFPTGMRDRYDFYREPQEQTLHVGREAIRDIKEDGDGITVRFVA